MNLQPKIKERLIRHINQSFVPINSLKKLRILKEETCKECGEKISDYEHILFACPTSRYIWELTRSHINATYDTKIDNNVINFLLPNMEKFTKNISNESHKKEIDTLIAVTISSNHNRFHEKNRLLTEHSDNEILKIVNNNIKTLIMNYQSTKLNLINHINFPKLEKNIKEFLR